MSDSPSGTPGMAQVLRGFSVEVSPREPKIINGCVERLEKGTEVYLTWIPGEDPYQAVTPAATLRRGGLIPVPHVGARHVQNPAQLDDFLGRLVSEAGVDRVLLIGGDRDEPAGPFDSSLKVMESGLLQKHNILRADVGGFPEGHPRISEKVLEESMVAKTSYAARSGLRTRIVTQFCFEGQPIVDWLKRLRGTGVTVPVRLGLAGPAGIATLTRYALHCGVGNSIRVLTKSASFAKLITDHNPEPILREILAAAPGGDASQSPLGIAGLHFYTFGGLKKTVEWVAAARAQ